MIRISATNLDAFRRYRDSEDASLEDLLAYLRRETPPTPPMLAGKALHKALEIAAEGEHDTLAADGYTFDFSTAGDVALADIREMKLEVERTVGGTPVTLVGVVDGIRGREVIDHKLTSRFDPERFLSSYQWRVYLSAFDADRFTWIVYEGVPERDDPQRYTIRALHHLTAHRYPEMEADLERELAAYVAFAKAHLVEAA